MVYYTTERASTSALSAFTRDGTMSIYDFVGIPREQLGWYSYATPTGISRRPLFAHEGNFSYGSLGGVVGTQKTYSWRTGHKDLDSTKSRTQSGDLSGPEMRRAILSGYDVSVEPDRTGLDRITDRKGSTFAGLSDYDSGDNGHEFDTVKTVHHHAVAQYTTGYPITISKDNPTALTHEKLEWWGPAPVCSWEPSLPSYPQMSRNDRDVIGNRVFKGIVPTRSQVNTVRSIGELIKDGLPNLIGLGMIRDGAVKGTAGEYLNYQFGIAPVVSDLRKLSAAVKDSHKILSQHRRDTGRWVRRSRVWEDPPENAVYTTTSPGIAWGARLDSPSGGSLNLASFLGSSGALRQGSVTSTLARSHKFVGQFSYMIPGTTGDVFDRFDSYLEQADHLLGLSFDAATLYDLLPFSWLLDWVVDFGTVFDNAVALSSDHLVCKYAYHMSHETVRHHGMVTGMKDINGGDIPPVIFKDTVVERKSRDRANPYGFNVALSGLTSYQTSILAALGLGYRK